MLTRIGNPGFEVILVMNDSFGAAAAAAECGGAIFKCDNI
jgi:hypothetical protein